MKREYRTDLFRWDFSTVPGTVSVGVLLATLGFFALTIYFLVKLILLIGWPLFAQGLVNTFFPKEGSDELFPLLGFLVMFLGCLFLVRGMSQTISLDGSSISTYRPLVPYLENMRILKEPGKTNISIEYERIELIRTDIVATLSRNGPRFSTIIQAGEDRIYFPLGFVGYFSILDELEARAPHAKFDANTTLILENKRKGIALNKTNKALWRDFRTKFKANVPSYWQRQRILRQARLADRGILYFADILEAAESDLVS